MKFKCDQCGFQTGKSSVFKNHQLIHSEDRTFKCDICDYRTRHRGNLKRHVSTHSDERPFKCDICDYRTRHRGHLKRHVSTHSDGRPFKCDICDYRTRHRGHLKRHVSIHSDERPFKCDICDYRTRTRTNLYIHVTTHSDERPFKCHICDYSARKRGHLNIHVTTHGDERPFKCDICEYRAKTRCNLSKHLHNHSDERPFKCDICDYRTRKRENLKIHNVTHSDERPFKCIFCDFAAKLKQVLKDHIARLHPSKSGIERKIPKGVSSKRKKQYNQSTSKRKRASAKDNARKPDQAVRESNLSDSNEVQSGSRSTVVADFVFPLKQKADDKRRSSQLERSGTNTNHDSLNEIPQPKELEIHSESDPDEPRNATDNSAGSQSVGSNLKQGISVMGEFNTICPTIGSEEIKKEPEPLSNDNFSSEFDLNCVKLENEVATPFPSNEVTYDLDASRLNSNVKWEEPIDHLKNEFGFHNNDAVDQDSQLTNKRCSIILTRLEDSGNYLGCYYIRMKEPPYLYEAVKVNLNNVI